MFPCGANSEDASLGMKKKRSVCVYVCLLFSVFCFVFCVFCFVLCVCVHVHASVCTCARACARLCICVRVDVCACVRVHLHVRTCARAFVRVCACVCVDVRVRTREKECRKSKIMKMKRITHHSFYLKPFCLLFLSSLIFVGAARSPNTLVNSPLWSESLRTKWSASTSH